MTETDPRDAATVSQQRLAAVLTAEEFKAFMAPEVEVEANFTEAMNEDRTLADYLADLKTRIERLLDPDDELWSSVP